MNKRVTLLLTGLLALLHGTVAAERLTWYDGEHPVTYQVQGKVAPVVSQALQMFCSDMQLVTGHTPVAVPSIAATCTEDGLTEGSKCSVCGQVLVAQEIIPATGLRNMAAMDMREATADAVFKSDPSSRQ